MKPKPKKRSAVARALTSALFRQRKRPSKKLYRRHARTKNAGLRDQAGGFVFSAGGGLEWKARIPLCDQGTFRYGDQSSRN